MTMIRPAQERALVALARRFRPNGVPFQVGGGCLLVGLGLDVDAGDIDLVVPSGELASVQRAAGKWWRGPVDAEPVGRGLFRSAGLARLEVEGEPVDVIAGLAALIGGTLWRVPFRPGPEWNLGGVQIPLAPPGQWLVLYRVYRPERARLLAGAVDVAELERTRSELPPGMDIESGEGQAPDMG